MPDDFRDALVALVAREVHAARTAGDDDRLFGAVADLAESLGKTIAIVGGGQPLLIDKMLTAADGVIVQTATEVGGWIAQIHEITKKGARK